MGRPSEYEKRVEKSENSVEKPDNIAERPCDERKRYVEANERFALAMISAHGQPKEKEPDNRFCNF